MLIGLLLNLIASVVFGAAFALFRAKKSALATCIYWGSAGLFVVASIFVLLSAQTTNTWNVQHRVDSWLSNLETPHSEVKDDSNAFTYKIVAPTDNVEIVIFRTTGKIPLSRPERLQVWSSFMIPKDELPVFYSLPLAQRHRIARAITQDLNKAGVGNGFIPEGQNPDNFIGIQIAKSVALSTLTENSFVYAIDQVDQATVIARNSFTGAMDANQSTIP